MVTVLLLTVTVILLTLLYLKKPIQKRMRLIKMVDKLPGPKAYPLIGSVLDIIVSRDKVVEKLTERVNKYKPIYRVWLGPIPNVVITLPEHIEIILNNMKYIDKGNTYKFLHPWLGTGLLTSSGAKWHSHRKMITPTFHFKILENFIEVFVEKTNILAKKLEKYADNQESFNIYPYITRCALDIIGETAMGSRLNAQQETDSPYINAIYDLGESLGYRFVRPWLHPDFIFSLTSRGKRYQESLKTVHSFTDKIIQERRVSRRTDTNVENEISSNESSAVGIKRRKAFLDLLLDASVDGKKLTDLEIREEVDTFMFEGHDTTTAGVGWSLFLLGMHKDIQNRVFEELDSIFQSTDRQITMHDLQDMKYLEQVIKEALRIFPSVPVIQRQINEDTQIGQYTIPAGCIISLPIAHVHQNEEHFPNPREFNPDNFLPERCQNRHPYAYIPFSAGPRNCIGQKFALLEEKTILASILRNYEVTSMDTVESIGMTIELILRPLNGVKVKISRRHRK